MISWYREARRLWQYHAWEKERAMRVIMFIHIWTTAVLCAEQMAWYEWYVWYRNA